MAGNKIEIDLSVQDKSGTIKQRTNEAKELNQELDRASKNIGGTAIPTGTKAGAQAMRASYSTSAAAEKVSSDSTVGLQRTTVTTGFQRTGQQTSRQAAYSPSQNEVEDYTTAGGVTGRGGARARDFANEAQGLGGLVRLYATYAANVFAVSAAFNALRDAMSTDMLLKGLDELGSRSGVALGGLAKQFAATTDGAISLRTSAEMTAKAISSGMSPEQLLELGKVAKGASQALGVNMEDAVSRLTRGIVKLEPELLDELGLFTKTGKAAEDYARMVGKSESQLSDFERRQAFANAVIKEGKDKFAEIALAGNPFDQLLSSLKNVAQDILSVVTKIVGPVAKFLAENTELIGLGIAAAVAKITTQAIPVLGQWQNTLAKTAAAAKEHSAKMNIEFAANLWNQREAQSKPLQDLTKRIHDQATMLGQAYADGFKNITPEQRKTMEKGLNDLIRERESILEKIENKAEFRREGARGINARVAAARSAQLDLLQQVPQLVGEKGMRAGLAEFYSKVNADEDIKRVNRFGTVVKGTLVGVAAQAAIVGRAIGSFLPILQIAGVAFYALDAIFSTNSKAVRELDGAIGSLEENTKTAKNTMEKFMGVMSGEAIVAISNNFNGMTKSIGDTAKALKEFDKTSSRFDKFMEYYKGNPMISGATGAATGALIGSAIPLIGTAAGAAVGGLAGVAYGAATKQERTKAAEGVADIIVQSIKSAPEGDIRDSLANKLSKALGTAKLDKKAIVAALEGSEDLGSLLEKIRDTFAITDSILERSKILVKNVEESTKKQEQSYLNLVNSVRDNSPLTVFLMDTLNRTQSLSAAFGDVLAARAGLESLSKTGPALVGLTGDDLMNMQQIISDYDIIILKEKDLTKEIKKRKDEFSKVEGARGKSFDEYAKNFDTKLKIGKPIAADIEFEAIRNQEKALKDFEIKIQELSNQAADIAQKTVAITMDKMVYAHELMMKKTALEASRSMLSLSGQTVTSVDLETKLNKEIIKTEMDLINVNRDLVMQLELNRISTEQLKDTQLLLYYKERERDTNLDPQERLLLTKQIEGITKKLGTYGKVAVGSAEGMDTTSTRDVSAEDLTKLINLGDPKKLQAFINETGATAYQSLMPILMKAAADKQAMGLKLSVEDVKNIVKREQVRLEEIAKDSDSSIKKLNASMSSYSQALGGGFGQMLSNFATDARDKLDVQKIEDQIDVQRKLLESPKASAESKAAAQADIDRLNNAKNRLTSEQNLNKSLRDQNAQIQIAVDLTKALADAQVAAFESRIRLINTGTSVGMQAAEQLRQQAFAARQSGDIQAQALATAPLRGEIAALEAQQDEVGLSTLSAADAARLKILKEAIEGYDRLQQSRRSAGQITEGTTQQLAAADIEVKKYDEKILKERNLRELQNTRQEAALQFAGEDLQRSNQRIQIMGQLGLLTSEDLRKADLVRQSEELRLKLEYTRLTTKEAITRAEEDYQRVVTQEESKAKNGQLDAAGKAAVAQALATKNQAQKIAQDRLAFAEQGTAATQSFITEQTKLSDFMIKTADVVKGSFGQMADAIVNFARTGKFSFKDLVTDMLANLIRLQLNQQMMALHSMLFPSATSAAAGSTNLGSLIATGIKSLFGMPPTPSAMGNAYSNTGMMSYALGGIPGYAKGGTFTNQIVNQPTLFRAANGMGLMGEAGPEAIMPLKRDSSGRLGVSGGGNDISVVVNNYGKERAEVKESTDGRGNRRIEVVVGEMVSGELTRVGSPLQQTFSNTYGLSMPPGRR